MFPEVTVYNNRGTSSPDLGGCNFATGATSAPGRNKYSPH